MSGFAPHDGAAQFSGAARSAVDMVVVSDSHATALAAAVATPKAAPIPYAHTCTSIEQQNLDLRSLVVAESRYGAERCGAARLSGAARWSRWW